MGATSKEAFIIEWHPNRIAYNNMYRSGMSVILSKMAHIDNNV